mmetsp:Transcript_118110/g.329294  ORF Transcript_118110/g.329294 Transcript_118110/m.329294 type:complete len:204 (-) Transcript_118110:538-1149(-)
MWRSCVAGRTTRLLGICMRRCACLACIVVDRASRPLGTSDPGRARRASLGLDRRQGGGSIGGGGRGLCPMQRSEAGLGAELGGLIPLDELHLYGVLGQDVFLLLDNQLRGVGALPLEAGVVGPPGLIAAGRRPADAHKVGVAPVLELLALQVTHLRVPRVVNRAGDRVDLREDRCRRDDDARPPLRCFPEILHAQRIPQRIGR